MKRTIILILLNLLSVVTFGQKLTKDNLLVDLHFLNNAVVNGHPVNYQQDKKVNIKNIIAMVERTQDDTFTPLEYTLWIEKAIYNIGCVHTSITKNPVILQTATYNYFPCILKFFDDGIFISNSADTNLIGNKILSINQVDATTIKEVFTTYKASDGKTDAFSKQYFQFASTKLISIMLNNPAFYDIVTDKGTFKLPATPKPITKTENNSTIDKNLTNNDNFLTFSADIPILRFRNFSKTDIKFVEKSFGIIKAKKCDQLIIDLRQNTGGNRKAAIELTRHLAGKPFSYSILQPELQTRKYMDSKGKFFLFLSKLKYNIGNIFKGHKTDLGREFVYNYKPEIINHFDGKIYVLTDGFTASASTMVTSWLKQFTTAKFFGSQAAGGYNGNNGGSFPTLTLPNSKIEIVFPAYRLILDKKSSFFEGIIPDYKLDDNSNYKEIIDIINGNL